MAFSITVRYFIKSILMWLQSNIEAIRSGNVYYTTLRGNIRTFHDAWYILDAGINLTF